MINWPMACYVTIGFLVYVLTWLGTFIYSMVYAWSEWGWLLACALGWIPSAIVASLAAGLAFLLWPIVALWIGVLALT